MTSRFAIFFAWLLAGGACAPHADAAHPPSNPSDASRLLDAWAAAAGGRTRLAGIAMVHAHGRMEMGGLSGTFESWEGARGERREEHDLGGVDRLIEVFDGTHGWLVDRNHHVRDLDGAELEDQAALAYLGANAALLPDRRPGRATRAGEAVRLEPAGARTLTVTFDPATHLPATISRPDAEKTRVLTLSDWREVGGVRFPFALRDEDGDPRDTRSIQLDSITVDGTAPSISFTRPADPPPDWRIAAGDRASMPLEIRNGLLIVQVGVNGSAPLSFLIDTGAEVSVINSSRLARLGLQPVGDLAIGAGGGDVAMSYVKGVSFSFPGVVLNDQIVTAIPLDPLEPLFGHPIDGVLGYDFLSRFVVQIDYEKEVLTLFDPAHFSHSGGEAIPITFAGSVPNMVASITLKDRPPVGAEFVIDTGCACEVSFNAPFTRAQKLLEGVTDAFEPPSGSSRGAGGETHQMVGHIEALSFGHQTLKRPVADFATDTTGATADPESAGLLGGQVWRRFTVTFDYTHKTMWLDPNPPQAP